MEGKSCPLSTNVDVDVDELHRAQTLVYYHVFNVAGTMSINCALELGIHDTIHRVGGGPITLTQLAEAMPELNPDKLPYLSRLMRLLVQLDFLAKRDDGYVLTPFSRVLLKSNPTGMAEFYLGLLHPALFQPLHHLSEWFKGDASTPFQLAQGKKVWEFLQENPELSSMFNKAMFSGTRSVMDVVVRDCDDVFSGISSLVDVGGGYGAAAIAIAKAFPAVKCTVLDLPQVVHALELDPDGSIYGGVNFVAGDMFQHIPSADAIFLKSILHDWNDEDCVKILKCCKESLLANGGKLIVIEVILNCTNNDPKLKEAQLLFDVTMMLAHAAKERDEDEWRAIFTMAGFSDFKIKHVIGIRSLMEVYP